MRCRRRHERVANGRCLTWAQRSQRKAGGTRLESFASIGFGPDPVGRSGRGEKSILDPAAPSAASLR